MLHRWRVAGRKLDIISAILNRARKHESPALSLKRSRDDIRASSHETTQSSSPVSKRQREESQSPGSYQQTDNSLSLPLNTEELGRLSPYESFDYVFEFQPQHAHYQPQSHFISDATAPSVFGDYFLILFLSESS